MDDHNFNIKFHQEFSAHFKESNIRSHIDIDSCSLHIIHRRFTTGAEKSGWKLRKVLKGAYHMLHNTPARKEDYESLTDKTSGILFNSVRLYYTQSFLIITSLNLDYFIVTMTDSNRRNID